MNWDRIPQAPQWSYFPLFHHETGYPLNLSAMNSWTFYNQERLETWIQLSSVSGWHTHVCESRIEARGNLVGWGLTVSWLCLPCLLGRKTTVRGKRMYWPPGKAKCLFLERTRFGFSKMPLITFMLTAEWEDQSVTRICPHLPVSIALRLNAGGWPDGFANDRIVAEFIHP